MKKDISDEYIESLYKGGKSTYKISKELNINSGIVYKALVRNGVKLNTANKDKFINFPTEEIITLYKQGLSCEKIAKLKSFSVSKITRTLTKLNIINHCKKYNCDESYFDSLDSNNKGYLLGFFAADGCLHTSSYSYNLALLINPKDIEILNFYNRELKSNNKIVISKVYHNILNQNKGIKKYYDRASLRITSRRLGEALIKLGITSQKSKNLKFIDYGDNIMPHFLRGLIDGDGCVYYSDKTNNISIIGNSSYITELSKYLEKIQIKSSIYKRNDNTYIISFYGKNLIKLIKFLQYDSNEFSLSRKKEKIIKIINKIKNKNSN